MDIHTDSILALQYYENTCLRDSPHLAALWDQTEQIATSAHIQFRLIHVKAHANDLDNNNVDSMCTAVILANDTPQDFKLANSRVRASQQLCNYKKLTSSNGEIPNLTPLCSFHG